MLLLRHFLKGLIIGMLLMLLLVAAVLYPMQQRGVLQFEATQAHGVIGLLQWAGTNLGSSIPVFAVLLIAYVITLQRLADALAATAPVKRILHLDQLADVWTTMFFGTGVIWTAIGMRSALMFALGDRTAALNDGAFAMLERLIDGGILLALSTTIFGGVGGYLMRAGKMLMLGTQLQECYEQAARSDATKMQATLERIEAHLQVEAGR